MATRLSNPESVRSADEADGKGDRSAAVSKFRAHLAAHPDDGDVRLKLAELLLELAEPSSARVVLAPLDGVENQAWTKQANRLLALLDEGEGALTAAQMRWERVLADDIDDPQARSHLQALGPPREPGHHHATFSVSTLASPEGVRLSRFKLIREVGRGATAAVYLVRDERLKLPLALKVLHPQLAATSRREAREKFFAEARLAAGLRHPGVVTIYGIDEAARCLAMEYIEGGTVRDRLRAAINLDGRGSGETQAAIDAMEIVATARSLLAALVYVHGAGIVHGDLKPGNLLLRRPTEVVLADFGVAEFASSAAAGERAGGTPLYLAPEQFRGALPSVATDLFAAGAILWEMLHGHPARRQADLLAGDYAAPAIGRRRTTPRDGDDATVRLVPLIDALLSTDPGARPLDATAALALLD
jgi:tRNA A-37 threonylcarbamoyl transferase component Bud32